MSGMFKLYKRQQKALEQYPHLKQYVEKFIENDGRPDNPGYLSDLVFYFRCMIEDNGLDEDEVFGWDKNTSEDFYSWGHNSRWANTVDYYICSHFKKCIDIILQLTEDYGDINLYRGEK